jgi:type VI secretion system protein ImpD/type VI secretion system protein ImpC
MQRPDPTAGLRDTALAGRFLSQDAPAAEMAEFIVEPEPAAILRRWFGRETLTRIATTTHRREVLEEAMDRDIAAIDTLIARQLDAILHHHRLRRLEGSWRGLLWLVDGFVQDRLVKVRLLVMRWQELSRDLERAAEFDQSHMFRMIYEEEFGTAGGEPFGMIVGDYEIRPGPAPGHPVDDVAVLNQLAAVGAAAFCPIVLPASPALLGINSFHEANTTLSLTALLRTPERARWRSLTGREDTRFLALVLPRTLGRAAWQDDGSRADRFRYREDAGQPEQRVWTTAVYSLASVAARAFALYRWPAQIRGAETGWDATGGVVDTLPHERFRADPPGPPPRPPLELSLTDDQEREASEAGIVALCGLEALPEASFGAVPSMHKPPRMTADLANANQRMSAHLNSVLCVSRFAHIVKLMGRDMVGSAMDAPEVELRLQQWLNRHITGLAGSGGEAAAKYPLSDARVEVRERPGRPGSFGCTIMLQPHYQLDEVGASFRLVTDLAASRAAA